MTAPYLMSCIHTDSGWCIKCVHNLLRERDDARNGRTEFKRRFGQDVATLRAEIERLKVNRDYWQTAAIEAQTHRDGANLQVGLRDAEIERLCMENASLAEAQPGMEQNLKFQLEAARAEIAALKPDANRWRFYAGPQTALMLGSQLDPNDQSVDWLAECNRLADKIMEAK